MIVPVKTARITRSALRIACLASALGISAHAQTIGDSPSDTPKPPAKQTTSPANNVPSAQEVKPTGPTKAEPAPASDSDTIMLSPFEVVSDNKGYMATNTASGTRLNSRLEDLASPISVVTKQQLNDMASVDINDIFRSEANVEGLFQYTEFSSDRGSIIDTASNNPESANRIRGMGAANITSGGMSRSSAIPIDTYNVDSVEINRGANSNIFGIGSTSGTVNLSPSTGNLSRDFSKVMFRVDHLGGFRQELDFNRVLLKDKFAIRVIGVNDDVSYFREPSYNKTKRFTLAARAQPFANSSSDLLRTTSLKVSYETYRNDASLPNMMTPREGITQWQQQGSHTWNPFNSTLYNSSGAAIGVYDGRITGTGVPVNNATTLASGYNFFGGGNLGGSNHQRPLAGYINGQMAYLTDMSAWRFSSVNATAATYVHTGDQRMVDFIPFAKQIFVPDINPATGQPYGLINSVLDDNIGVNGAAGKALYDWEEYNLNGTNRTKRNAEVKRWEFEQYFLDAEHHKIAVQLAGLYESIDNRSWNYIGNGGDGVSAYILPDVNQTLPNGSPNPGYLRPYLASRQPQRYDRPEENLTHKVQIAYLTDFTKNEGLTKWLGRHNIVGYGEYRERRNVTSALRYRTQLANQDGLLNRRGNADSLNTRYYLGDGSGFNVDNPGTPPDSEGVFPFNYYSTAYPGTGIVPNGTDQWRTDSATLASIMFTAQNPLKTEIRTQGFVWQAFLWEDRIIPVFGYREDKIRFASAKPLTPYTYSIGSSVYTDAYPGMFDFNDIYNLTNYKTGARENYGITRQHGLVVKPFKGFTKSSFLDGISLTYNESASFDPAGLAVDTWGDILPNPEGTSKDYGIRFSMLNDRLWISLNRYEAETKNSRNGSANVLASRPLSFDIDNTNALDPDDSSGGVTGGREKDLFDWYFFRIWGATQTGSGTTAVIVTNPGDGSAAQGGDPAYRARLGITTQQQAIDHVYERMGYSKETVRNTNNINGASRSATNDVTSEGYELEILYSTANWSVKLTGAERKTIDTNIAEGLVRYISERQPILEAAAFTSETALIPSTVVGAPPGSMMANPAYNLPESYWLTTYDSSGRTHRDNYYGEVLSIYDPLVANLGKPRPQLRRYSASLTTSYNLAGISQNSILKNIRIGGNASWASKAAIGYGYAAPMLDSPTAVIPTYTIRKVDPNKRYYDKARGTVSLFASYDFRLFSGRIKSSLQLNIDNVLEDGRLQAVEVNSDGQGWAYRIIDPRKFLLTMRFDL